MLLVRASLSDELGVPCREIGKRSGRRRAKKTRGDQSDGGGKGGKMRRDRGGYQNANVTGGFEIHVCILLTTFVHVLLHHIFPRQVISDSKHL